MRKRYFLALAASVLCGMSVEALVPVGEKRGARAGGREGSRGSGETRFAAA